MLLGWSPPAISCIVSAMTEHFCSDGWRDGPVGSCSDVCHVHRGVSAPDVSPYTDAARSRLRVDGVAKSGQVSPKGTVEHTDYWSGRVAAKAKPAPVSLNLWRLPWFRERFVYRDGKLFEKATGKEARWTCKDSWLGSDSSRSKRSGDARSVTARRRGNSKLVSLMPGVGIGKGGVLLTRTGSSRASSKDSAG